MRIKNIIQKQFVKFCAFIHRLRPIYYYKVEVEWDNGGISGYMDITIMECYAYNDKEMENKLVRRWWANRITILTKKLVWLRKKKELGEI